MRYINPRFTYLLTYLLVPNLKSLRAAVTEIRMAVQNVQIGVIWGSEGSLEVIRNVTIR